VVQKNNDERKENFTVDDFNEHNYSMVHFGAALGIRSVVVFGWTNTLGRAFWRRSRGDNVCSFLFVSSRSHHL
jgi:hypothetical protein